MSIDEAGYVPVSERMIGSTVEVHAARVGWDIEAPPGTLLKIEGVGEVHWDDMPPRARGPLEHTDVLLCVTAHCAEWRYRWMFYTTAGVPCARVVASADVS